MATAVDPICNMDVDTDNPNGGKSDHNDVTYYFCAPGCKIAFDKDPEKYLADVWEGISMNYPGEHPRENPAKKGGFFSKLFGKG